MGCRVELPRLQPLFETYRDRGFEIVAVDGKRDTDRARKFIEQKGLTYTLLENGEGDAEIASRLFGIRAYPSSFLVDREGRVLFFHEGYEDGDDVKLAKEIERLIQG
jgi:peroxiredoxin